MMPPTLPIISELQPQLGRLGGQSLFSSVTVKTRPKAFRSGGFSFKLLKRDGDIALFRKTKPGFGFESFEVVIIQRTRASK